MSSGGKRGDRVLESRHLIVLFLGIVLLCGVFFTLGYVIGHNQYDGAVHAAEAPEASAPVIHKASKPAASGSASATTPGPANSEWDFYSKNASNHLDPTEKPSSAATPAAAPANKETSAPPAATEGIKAIPVSSRFQPPRMLKGSVVLQVAAVTHQSDAVAMADALQRKKFSAFVLAPSGDNFYRVQVGPYRDERNAESAKNALERAGFKSIIKR
ncbi:MAG TPA: SPOR domain-containing protein [Candidatus Acidoferrales bacterium]|nr:SPOR domain-containing protein [Candidatus Acidoferrales bacterium]